MTGFRAYNLILISTVFLLSSVLAFSSLSTQPYEGDLTRLGGYSEKQYGWNQPQETFIKPLFKYAKNWSDYDRPYDIVVIGDSFSKNTSRGWQNFLVNNTGFSLITYHIDRFKISDLLKHPQFLATPPAAVIYQSVERMAILRLSRESNLPNFSATATASQLAVLPLQPKNVKTEQQERNKYAPFITKLNVTSDLASKGFVRDILGLHLFKSTTLDLKQTLFSSQKGNQLLFLKSHLSNRSLSLAKLEKAVLGAEKTKNLVEQNGFTRFYLLVFPNKISVYRDQLSNTNLKIASFYDYQEHFSPFGLINLYAPLYQAVSNHEIDIYFSDDTHTSAKGYKMAAEQVQRKMIGDGALFVGNENLHARN